MPEIEKLVNELIEEVRAGRAETKEHLNKISKILMGNGEPGICEQMRIANSHIRAIWGIIGVFGAAMLTGVFRLLFTR